MAKRTRTRQVKGEYVVVLVTCGSRGEAMRIARAVVSARMAACVNAVEAPLLSVYRWKGKVQHAREWLLVIKTSRSRQRALRAEVERLHSYEVPEFLVLPVLAGSPAYLAWLDESVRAK